MCIHITCTEENEKDKKLLRVSVASMKVKPANPTPLPAALHLHWYIQHQIACAAVVPYLILDSVGIIYHEADEERTDRNGVRPSIRTEGDLGVNKSFGSICHSLFVAYCP